MKKKKLIIEGNVKKLINLIELGYKIPNKLEVIIFLREDILELNAKYNQKTMAPLLGFTEPTYSAISKVLEAMDRALASDKSIDIIYNNSTYALTKE